jgi:hypothetical protein
MALFCAKVRPEGVGGLPKAWEKAWISASVFLPLLLMRAVMMVLSWGRLPGSQEEEREEVREPEPPVGRGAAAAAAAAEEPEPEPEPEPEVRWAAAAGE